MARSIAPVLAASPLPAIDTAKANSLLSLLKKGGSNASVLYEVPRQEGDQEPQEHRHEEQETGNRGRLPDLWHQSLQDWQVGCQQIPERKEEGLDIPRLGVSSPFVLPITHLSEGVTVLFSYDPVGRIKALASRQSLCASPCLALLAPDLSFPGFGMEGNPMYRAVTPSP